MKKNFGQVGVSFVMGTFRNGCCVVNMSKNVPNVLVFLILTLLSSYKNMIRSIQFSSYRRSNMLFFQFVCMCMYWWEQSHQCYLCNKIGFFNMAYTVEHSLLPQQFHVKCEPVVSVNCRFVRMGTFCTYFISYIHLASQNDKFRNSVHWKRVFWRKSKSINDNNSINRKCK